MGSAGNVLWSRYEKESSREGPNVDSILSTLTHDCLVKEWATAPRNWTNNKFKIGVGIFPTMEARNGVSVWMCKFLVEVSFVTRHFAAIGISASFIVRGAMV